MPTLLRFGPYRFAFFANEGREPPHVHVYAAESEAKYWLIPMSLAKSKGFRSDELAKIEAIILEHGMYFLEKWHEFHKRSR